MPEPYQYPQPKVPMPSLKELWEDRGTITNWFRDNFNMATFQRWRLSGPGSGRTHDVISGRDQAAYVKAPSWFSNVYPAATEPQVKAPTASPQKETSAALAPAYTPPGSQEEATRREEAIKRNEALKRYVRPTLFPDADRPMEHRPRSQINFGYLRELERGLKNRGYTGLTVFDQNYDGTFNIIRRDGMGNIRSITQGISPGRAAQLGMSGSSSVSDSINWLDTMMW